MHAGRRQPGGRVGAGANRGAVLVQQHRDHRDRAQRGQEKGAVADRAAGHGRHRLADERIQAEAKNPRGDVLWSGGFGTLGAYKDLLEPYKAPGIEAIPPEFRGPGNLWVGTNLHVMVMMVNERQLKGLPAPKTWSDLMKPEWKGKFAITDPSKSATAYMLVYGLLKQFGKDGLEKIAANAVVTSSSGSTYKGTARANTRWA
jgi:ABC-type Fe3+ transport system substrate-binding protein